MIDWLPKRNYLKLLIYLAIGAAVFLFLIFVLGHRPGDLAPGVDHFGVTFSKKFAEELKLDWKKAYLAILDDLKPKHLRLPVYWNEVEKNNDAPPDFKDLDFQVKEASKRGVKLILAVGRKLPRWPECHEPVWARRLTGDSRRSNLMDYIKFTVDRYKNDPAVEYWQVENEPFLDFGDCPELDKELLAGEIELVHQLAKQPVLMTDSGELGRWLPAYKRADVFGTTMYRTIWSPNLENYFTYPLWPGFFYIKANLSRLFYGPKEIIVSELQAEPWGPKQIYDLTPEEMARSMNLSEFRKSVGLAKAVGFKSVYLWGAEWWYSEKQAGRPEIWEEAKSLFPR